MWPGAKALVRNSLVVAAAVWTVIGVSACDQQKRGSSPASGPNRQVTVVGSGQVQGTPDTMTFDVSIQTTAPDSAAAMTQTSDRSQQFIDQLTQNGVDRKDIATVNVSVGPHYGTDPSKIIDYQATNTLTVKIHDLGVAPRVFDVIKSTGDAAHLNSTTLSIGDDSQLVKDARARAFADAKGRAEQYAKLAGVKLGEVISISETGGAQPPVPLTEPRPAAMPVEPGQQTVSFSVTVVWEIG